MIDLAGPHGTLSLSDFQFRVGNNNSPTTWGTANLPTSMSVRTGAGHRGSDRIEFVWATGSPTKQWLEVISLANGTTNLPQKAGYPVGQGDVFFFGNSLGNSGLGDTATNAIVNATDESGARLNPAGLLNNIPNTNIYDYDRNAQVNATDQNAAHLNTTNLSTHVRYLNLTSPPAAPESDGGGGDDSEIASALSVPASISLPERSVNSTGRVDSPDIERGGSVRLFQHLQEVSSPRSRTLSQKFDAVADALGLDDELLDLLAADFGG